MLAIAVLLPVTAVVIGALLLGEVHRYRAGPRLISARRFRLRLAAGLISVLLSAALFVLLFGLPRPLLAAHPAVGLALAVFCLVAAVAVMFIMVADVQEVEDRGRQRRAELWRDFARSVAGKEPDGETGRKEE